MIIRAFCCLLLFVAVPVNTQDNSAGDNSDKIAPKVHQIIQLTQPIEVPGSGEDNSKDTLTLECIASGFPMPTIEWSFEGVKFVKGKNPDGTDSEATVRHELKSNRLKIFKVKGAKGDLKYDTGRYRCIATNDVGSVFIEKFIQIRVMGKFTAENTKSQGAKIYNPVVGKSYSIDCPEHSQGYGTAYEWGVLSNQPSASYKQWEAGNPYSRIFPDPKTGKLWWSVVTLDDITDSNDKGGIRCVLVNNGFYQYSRNNLLYQKSGESTHEEVPKIVVPIPQTMVSPVDVDLAIICGAVGNPVPQITWQYQGIDIVRKSPGSTTLNFEFFKLHGAHDQELRIDRTTQYSGGNFKCTAINKRGKVWSEGQLTIQFPPKWIKPFPDSVDLAVDSYYKLVCNATGIPRPKFTWYQNSTLLHNVTRKTVSGEDVDKHNGGVLVIHKTEFKDNGIYICIAENELDTLTQSIFIKVQAKAPKFDIPLDDPIYLFRSETMTIKCDPSGGPIPQRTWFKDSVSIGNVDDTTGDSRIKVTNGYLQIADVRDSDAGLYTCKASNDIGSPEESSGTAVVLNRTVISSPIQEQVHAVGWKYAVFFCGVEWDQRLDLRVEWYKAGVRMAKFDNRVYLEDRAMGPPRLLYINDIRIEDAGNYSCHAYTKVGDVISEAWAYNKLVVKGPPEPPSGLKISKGRCDVKDPEITLTWNRGEEIGVKTREFFIEFSTNHSSLAGKWFGGEGDELLDFTDQIIVEPGDQVEKKLTKKELVPGANLIFRIRAASDHMVGKASRPSVIDSCNTLPGVPKINPLNVTGYSKGPAKLTIRWRPLTDVYFGAEGFKYVVFYREVKAENDDTSESAFTSEEILKDPTNNTYASELDISANGEGTEYEFYVISENKLGRSTQPPKKVRALSGREPPKEPPSNVRVARIDKFNVELSWDPVNNADSYRIKYWNVTDAESLRGRNKRATTQPFDYKYQFSDLPNAGTLFNLTAQVEYIVTVASMNNGGISEESSEVSFTSQARVPDIPLNVKVVVYGSSAHISWNPPLHPNGYIEQYEVSWAYSVKNDRQLDKPPERTTLKTDRRAREAYMISDFIPFRYYNLRLSARNRVGPGKDYEQIMFTVGAPDMPGKPGAPKTMPFDDTAINVTFQRPSYGGLPTEFQVFYRPRGNYFEEPKIKTQKFPKRAWILVKDLDFLVYDFWTIGVNDLGQSETSDLTEQQPIRKLKPQAHASEFEWWRSNWFIAISMCVLFVLITMITVILLLKDGPKAYKRSNDDKSNGYGGGYSGQKMQPMTSKPPAGAMGATAVGMGAGYGAGAAYGAAAGGNDKYDKNFSASEAEEHDAPPPNYSSQSSIEKKELISGSEYSGSETGSGSDYSDSETGSGSEYSDEEDGSYYSDEEKKRSDSEEDDDYADDAEDSTFV